MCKTEIRDQRSGNREQGTGNREQGTGNREQGTGNREQGTGNREQIVRGGVGECYPTLALKNKDAARVGHPAGVLFHP
jgi:hypothetical protein